MKPILKFTACIFLLWGIFLISCKKERSCEGCREKNQPPIARAGNDTAIILPIDGVTLNGSASTDPDGTITSYKWTKVSGPVSSNIGNPDSSKTLVKSLVKGVYKFELTVTDNGGLSAKDTMQVTVNDQSQTNQPPLANAGTDQTIVLPTNNVTIDGSGSSDPDNNITSYAWTKISGPSSFNITNTNAVKTQVTNLERGVYQFELKVTDAGGLFSKDTVQITVNAVVSTACDNSDRPIINAQLIPVGTLPEPRDGMVVASAGNKILFAGGYSTGSVSTRVDIFDFAANTWSTAELSSKRRRIAAVAAGNKIFFAGGINDYGWTSTDVDIYDVATDTWSLSNMSTGGDELTTATTGNKVFFAGGNFGIYATSTVNIYDLTSNTWSTASLSAPRNFPAAVSANNKVYFTGGDPWTGQISNVIDIYNNTTGVWSTSYLQVPRVRHATIAVNDILYFAGGYSTNSQPTCSVETLNTNTGARTLMNLSMPKGLLYAVVKDNKILFLRNDGLADSDKFDVYDIISNIWSIGVLPYKISGASIISVNNTTYVAGVSINGVLSNKVWKLEF